MYGCEVGVDSQTKLQNKNETSQKILCDWRKIAESIPQVDMKQNQTLSPRKKKHY